MISQGDKDATRYPGIMAIQQDLLTATKELKSKLYDQELRMKGTTWETIAFPGGTITPGLYNLRAYIDLAIVVENLEDGLTEMKSHFPSQGE